MNRLRLKFIDMSLDYVKLEFAFAVLAGIFLMLAVISYAFDAKAFIPLTIMFAILMWLSKMMEFGESMTDRRMHQIPESELPDGLRRQAD